MTPSSGIEEPRGEVWFDRRSSEVVRLVHEDDGHEGE